MDTHQALALQTRPRELLTSLCVPVVVCVWLCASHIQRCASSPRGKPEAGKVIDEINRSTKSVENNAVSLLWRVLPSCCRMWTRTIAVTQQFSIIN